MAQNKQLTAIRMESGLLDRVDRLAERLGITRTEVIERSLVAGLKEGEQIAEWLGWGPMRLMVRMFAPLASPDPEQLQLFEQVCQHVKEQGKSQQSL